MPTGLLYNKRNAARELTRRGVSARVTRYLYGQYLDQAYAVDSVEAGLTRNPLSRRTLEYLRQVPGMGAIDDEDSGIKPDTTDNGLTVTGPLRAITYGSDSDSGGSTSGSGSSWWADVAKTFGSIVGSGVGAYYGNKNKPTVVPVQSSGPSIGTIAMIGIPAALLIYLAVRKS